MTRRAATWLSLAPALVWAQAPNLTGTWNAEVVLDQGSGSPTFTFKQDGEKLTGKYTGMFGEEPLTGSIKGKSFTFTFRLKQGGETIDAVYEGTVEDSNTIKGKATYGSFAAGTFSAKRKSS